MTVGVACDAGDPVIINKYIQDLFKLYKDALDKYNGVNTGLVPPQTRAWPLVVEALKSINPPQPALPAEQMSTALVAANQARADIFEIYMNEL